MHYSIILASLVALAAAAPTDSRNTKQAADAEYTEYSAYGKYDKYQNYQNYPKGIEAAAEIMGKRLPLIYSMVQKLTITSQCGHA